MGYVNNYVETKILNALNWAILSLPNRFGKGYECRQNGNEFTIELMSGCSAENNVIETKTFVSNQDSENGIINDIVSQSEKWIYSIK